MRPAGRLKYDVKIDPPSFLDPVGRETFIDTREKLRVLGILDESDDKMLTLFSQAYSEFLQLTAIIDEKKHSYETFTKTGERMVKPRPEVAMRADAWRRCFNAAKDLCLSPASRKTKGETDDNNPMDHFIN